MANNDTELLALAGAIAAQMEGWTLQPPKEDRWYMLLVRDEMQIGIKRDSSGKRDRVNISTWSWPKYTKYERGEARQEQVTPTSLYDPKESAPSISCAMARGADAITKEIKRRFLPDYERIWKRCTERAEAYGRAEVNARESWVAICKAAGQARPVNGWIYAELKKGVTLRIENRSGSGHISQDFTAPQIAAIIEALKGLQEVQQ
jgi:hypothetical protein